jgi:hypothetical protein
MATVQTALPLGLFERLQQLRHRYAVALHAAAQGEYVSHARELRLLSRLVGRLLAEEARKSPEERGGLRMLDISLAVDQFLPELRGWNRHEIAERERRRLQEAVTSPLAQPRKQRTPRAS